MNAKLNFSFALTPEESASNQAIQSYVANEPVCAKPVLYDCTKLPEVLDPYEELKRYLLSHSDFAAPHHPGLTDEERRFFDFNFWLEHNRQHSTEFANAKLVELPGYQDKAISLILQLRKRYQKVSDRGTFTTNRPFLARLQTLYFDLWLTVLGVNVDQENQFNHFVGFMEAACCAVQMENVSFCVQVLAGQFVDDRDAYLAKLRPHFQKHLTRVSAKQLTCVCNEGMEQC